MNERISKDYLSIAGLITIFLAVGISSCYCWNAFENRDAPSAEVQQEQRARFEEIYYQGDERVNALREAAIYLGQR